MPPKLAPTRYTFARGYLSLMLAKADWSSSKLIPVKGMGLVISSEMPLLLKHTPRNPSFLASFSKALI